MEKNKRNKIIGLSIGILIVLIIVVSSTYAYWQITRTQETPNDIVAACLNLNLEDKSAAIDLDSAWPISDDEANSLTGYTFTVTNNCNEEINYIVGLNRVEESNYLQDSSIRLKLDEKSVFTYSELSDIDYADAENTYTSRVSKQVSVERIEANGANEHTIRVWLSESAPVSEQSKIFQGQVFITGGQGIEMEACYEIADNGTILSYDYSCGTEVKVPAEINGVKVKTINQASFVDAIEIYGDYGEKIYISGHYQYENTDYILYFKKLSSFKYLEELEKPNLCDDLENCDIASILEDEGYTILIGADEYNDYDWSKYDEIGISHVDGFNVTLTSLDLSDAIYLESIEEYSFSESPLETLIWPENGTLTTIGDGAFSSTKIKQLYFSDSLNEVSENAFADNSFDEVIISNNKWINENDWDNDISIKSLIIKSQVTVIPDSVFSGNNIEEVVFEDTEENPSQLTSIGEQAFDDNNLTKIELPSSLTNIAYSSFSNNNLTEIKIGNSYQANYRYFSNNPVKKVIISANITEIPENAFENNFENNYDLEEVIFENTEENPSKLTKIGASAFSSNKLQIVTIPGSVTTIGLNAFAHNQISNLTFEDTASNPSQLKTIEEYAFGGNQLEGTVVLPRSITRLGYYILGDNYGLTTIIIKKSEADALANMNLASSWNYTGDIGILDDNPNPTTGWAEVIYDPNYTE